MPLLQIAGILWVFGWIGLEIKEGKMILKEDPVTRVSITGPSDHVDGENPYQLWVGFSALLVIPR